MIELLLYDYCMFIVLLCLLCFTIVSSAIHFGKNGVMSNFYSRPIRSDGQEFIRNGLMTSGRKIDHFISRKGVILERCYENEICSLWYVWLGHQSKLPRNYPVSLAFNGLKV